jgi:phytoene dehydrogenase-like protein
LKTCYVVGSGPNGLTAAIMMARAGFSVTVLEEQAQIGGGTRSVELTLPGFVHDVCSAVHPMALSSPVFAGFPLRAHGLEWIHSLALAHPFDDGSCLTVERSSVRDWPLLMEDILAPPHLPRHPLLLARFVSRALLGGAVFRDAKRRALFAGMAAHSIRPLEAPESAAFGWVLMLSARAVGWPVARGGSQRIADALVSYLESLGGRVLISSPVHSLDEFERGAIVMCDVTPRQFVALAGARLPASYRRKLEHWRYGPGVFKVDWALDGPIPWLAADCARAATVHLGGSVEEIAESERAPWEGRTASRPFVLLAQASLFDGSRAPAGGHTVWGYCHVPNGCGVDMTEAIEAQIERFAPGFRGRILARHSMGPAAMGRHNSNLAGGDIGGGANTLAQVLVRPTVGTYRTPLDGVYLCSSSTPPGGGVHGMCGYWAARMAIQDCLARRAR